jgi:hypothetical protein
MSSEITLTIPAAREFRDVAHFVLGGLASQLQVTVEQLEDLQIALGEVLGCHRGDGALTLELVVGEARLDASVGPFDHDAVLHDLETDQEELGLRRVLEAVVDEVELTRRDGAGWIRFGKVLVPGAVA